MIFIALSTLFNTFILGLFIVIVKLVLHFLNSGFTIISNFECFIIGYIICAMCSIFGYSKFAASILGFLKNVRKPIGRELFIIQALLQSVISQVNKQYKTQYKVSDFNIKIIESKLANTFTLGYNVIVLSSGLLTYFGDNQIKALLAHNISYLYYRDSVRLTALNFGAIFTKVILCIYSIVIIAQAIIRNALDTLKLSHSLIKTAFVFLPIIIFLPLVIISYLGSKTFVLLSIGLNRKSVYKADAFVSSLGYKADLIEVLEIIDSITNLNNNFKSKALALEPLIIKRIGMLEDKTLQKQCNTSTNLNNIKELILLSTYLSFIVISLIIYQRFLI